MLTPLEWDSEFATRSGAPDSPEYAATLAAPPQGPADAPGGRDRFVDPLPHLGARRASLEVDEELAVALRALDRRCDHAARP